MRSWLHRHGFHWLCRVVTVTVPSKWSYMKEYLKLKDGDVIDVTSQGGTPIGWTTYRTHR